MFSIKLRYPLSVYFLIIGTIFLIGAGYHAWKTIDFYYIKESVAIEAIITNIETIERVKADRHEVYVSFELDNGNTQTSLLDTYVEGMKVGDTIKIIYNKNNPDEIILWWSSPLLIAAFGGVGILIIVITLVVRHYKRK